MSRSQRLIIISDYGLDDACALAYLLRFPLEFGQIDVVCVAGNAPSDSALANAQKLWNALSADDLRCKAQTKIRLVDTSGVVQQSAQLESVHGNDGMGDLFAAPRRVHSIPYSAWVQKLPDTATVLSLAPCTLALDILERLRGFRLIVMAGRVFEPPNHRGMEFNESLDPAAFDALVRFPHKIATLDTCRAEGFNTSGLRLEGKGLLQTLVNRTVELADLRHRGKCYIYDLIAALYLVIPEIFSARTVTDARNNQLTELYLAQKDFSLADYLVGLTRE